MGAKNLRAVAVRGGQKIKLADSTKVKSLVKWFTESYKDHPGCSVLNDLGTGKNVIPLDGVGMLPTDNFGKGSFEQALTLYYEMMGWEKKNGVPNQAKLHGLDVGWIKL